MIYSFAMSEKTIPWEFIERLLTDSGKTSKGLLASLEVTKSRFSNWKQRGVPLNQAAAIAGHIGISIDYLLQKKGAIKEAPTDQDFYPIIYLITKYNNCNAKGRRAIMDAADSAVQHFPATIVVDDQSNAG